MMDNIPTIQETEDGLTWVEVHFEKSLRKGEHLETRVSKVTLPKKKKGKV